MKKIVLTGGGTAGHVYPALALVDRLKDYEIHYIGGNGMERDSLKKYSNITYHEIPTVKLERKLTLKKGIPCRALHKNTAPPSARCNRSTIFKTPISFMPAVF